MSEEFNRLSKELKIKNRLSPPNYPPPMARPSPRRLDWSRLVSMTLDARSKKKELMHKSNAFFKCQTRSQPMMVPANVTVLFPEDVWRIILSLLDSQELELALFVFPELASFVGEPQKA